MKEVGSAYITQSWRLISDVIHHHDGMRDNAIIAPFTAEHHTWMPQWCYFLDLTTPPGTHTCDQYHIHHTWCNTTLAIPLHQLSHLYISVYHHQNKVLLSVSIYYLVSSFSPNSLNSLNLSSFPHSKFARNWQNKNMKVQCNTFQMFFL